MAVNFSPYSKIPGKVPEPPWQILPYLGTSGATGSKTSAAEEEVSMNDQFQKSYNEIMQNTNLSEKERKNKIDMLVRMRDNGGNPARSAPWWASPEGIIGAATKQVLSDVNKLYQPWKRNVIVPLQVGATELALGGMSIPGEILQMNNMSTPDIDKRVKVQQQELDNFLAAENVYNPDYNIFGSYSPFNITPESFGGHGKWIGPTARFAGEVLADPTTYLTLGASTSSRATRVALAVKFGEKEMLEKYPMMADRLNLVTRFGEAAIPEHIRWAEGIESGAKFMGQRIQGTDAVASLWMRTGGPARAAVGDALYGTTAGKKLLAYTAPKSLRPLIISGIGRKNATGELDDFIRGLAVFTSDKIRRAELTIVNKKLQAEIGPAFAVAKEAGVDMNLVTQVMENPTLYGSVTDEPTKNLIDALTNWYAGVGMGYRQAQGLLGADYDLAITEMAFVEDYVFHTLTKEGKAYRFGVGGSEGGMFNKGDISARDLIEGDGTVLFRKYRKAKLDEAGNPIDPEMFFDEPVIHGTIEEMNGIFDRYMVSQGEKPGQKWFETGADVVAKGYATSIANAHGRIAFIRRMFDFGDYAIEPMLYDIIPDKELVAKLTSSTAALKSIVGSLRRKASKSAGSAATKVIAGDGLEDVTNVAIAVLAGQRMASDAASAENLAAIAQVDNLMGLLEDARAAAVTATAASRTEFESVWINQLAEARSLREHLVRGEGERFAAMKILRTEYMVLHPDASVFDINEKSAEWLAEAIIRRYSGGKGGSRLLKKTEKAVEKLRTEMENLTGTEASTLDTALVAAEIDLKFAQRISDLRPETSYASEGVVYASKDEFGDTILNTVPLSNNAEYLNAAEIKVAISENDLFDPRDGAGMYLALSDENLMEDAVKQALDSVGIGEGSLLPLILNDALINGRVDNLFLEVYPEQAALIQTLLDGREYFEFVANRNLLETGIANPVSRGPIDAPYGDIVGFYGKLRNNFMDIAQTFEPGADPSVGHHMFIEFVSRMEGDALGMGSLVPMPVMHPELPANITSGQWSIITTPYSAKPVINDGIPVLSQLGDSITNGKLESHELKLSEGLLRGENIAAEARTVETKAVAGNDSIIVDGKKVTVKDALKRLTGLDESIEDGLLAVDAEVAKVIESKHGVEALDMGLIDAQSRMMMSFDPVNVLKNWDETVGEALSNEVGNMIELLGTKPAKGSTGALNRKWIKEVKSSLEAVASMEAGPAKDASERLLLMVFADEARLAAATAELDASEHLLGRALTAEDGIMIAKNLKKGWAELKGMGVQVPREVTEIWMPSMERLLARGQAGKAMRTLNTITDLWKRYVTSSPGFFVRNGMSATFMNLSDAIPLKDIEMGAKWAAAQVDTKGRTLAGNTYNNWMERAGVTNMDQADFAVKTVAAAGRGVSADNGIPGVSSGSRTLLADNAYLRFFSRKNDFVENMVRLPVAIDSFNRGHTLDQAIARVERLHLNYGDLSGLDALMKKGVPFWIWTSRNIPLQIAQMTTRPKAYYEYQRLREQFPNETEFTPQWIQDRMPLGIGSNLLTPDLPHVRLGQVAGSLATPWGLMGQSTPWLKLPAELYAGRQLGIEVGPFKDKQTATGYQKPLAWIFAQAEFTGLATYDTEGNLLIDPRINHFIETMVPPLAQVNRLSGGRTGGKDTLEERMLSSWANYFGIPLRQVKEDQQRSEVMRRKWMMIDMSGLLDDLSELRENKP